MLKVGILLGKRRRFYSWEMKIIEHLLGHERFEVAAVFVGSEAYVEEVGRILAKSGARDRVYDSFMKLERHFFKDPARIRDPWEECFSDLDEVPVVELSPTCRRYTDLFNDTDLQAIEEKECALLIRFGFRILSGRILQIVPHGIWSMHHGDPRRMRGDPPGFWEVYENHGTSKLTLIRLSDELDGGDILAQACVSTRKLASWNCDHLVGKTHTIVNRELERLACDGAIEGCPQWTHSGNLRRAPSIVQLMRYFFSSMLRWLYEILLDWLAIGGRAGSWRLNYGCGSFEKSSLRTSIAFEPPIGEYWADPFVYLQESRLFVIFEVFRFDTNLGSLMVGEVVDGQLVKLGTILERDTHISFPYIFEDGDEIYLIPETSAKECVEVWRAKRFPMEWELVSTKFCGLKLVDCMLAFFNDDYWLLASTSDGFTEEYETLLHAYRVTGPDLANPIPHRLNPVVADCRYARNAGYFGEYNGMHLRYSQRNIGGVYGAGLTIREISDISLTVFEEKSVASVKPEFSSDAIGLHHASQADGTHMFDTCHRRPSLRNVARRFLG